MQKKYVNLEKGTEELRIFLESTSPYSYFTLNQKLPYQRTNERPFPVIPSKSQPASPQDGLWSKIRSLTSSLADEISSFGKPKFNPLKQQPLGNNVTESGPVISRPEYPVQLGARPEYPKQETAFWGNTTQNVDLRECPVHHQPYNYPAYGHNQYDSGMTNANVRQSYPHLNYSLGAEQQQQQQYRNSEYRDRSGRQVTLKDPKDNCYYRPGTEWQMSGRQSLQASQYPPSYARAEDDVCDFIQRYRASRYSVNPHSNQQRYETNEPHSQFHYGPYSPLQ